MKTSNIPRILQNHYMCKRRCKLLAPGPLALSYIPFGLLNTAAVKTDSVSVGIFFLYFLWSIKTAPVFCALVSFRMAWLNDEKLLMAYGGDPQEILCVHH